MTLKTKFILPSLFLIVAGLSVNTWLTYRMSTDSLKNAALKKAQANLYSLLSMADLWIDGAENEIITISKTNTLARALSPMDEGKQDIARATALLQDSCSRHNNFDNLFAVNAQGVVVAASNTGLLGKDMASRDYFKKALAGQMVISPPLFSVDKGAALFVIAAPIQEGARIVGVLAAGITIGVFTNQFVSPLNSSTGYAYIAASDGMLLSHPDSGLIGKTNLFKNVDYGQQMVGRSNGALDVVSSGERKLILYETSTKTGWIIGMVINTEAAFADAGKLGLLILSLSGVLAVVLAAGIWIILSRNVLRPVGRLVGAATEIADGNLDVAVDTHRRDEIGSLERAMATMVGNLKAKIGEAEEKGRQAAAETQKACQAMAEADEARQKAELARQEGMLLAAEQLEGIVAAMTAASESISGQIDHLSEGSQEQARRIDETATAMEEMNATVIEVAQNASQAAQTADDARLRAKQGSDIVSRVIRGIGEVQTKALELRDDMTRLGNQAEGIGRVLNVISDIADQTNLLALNAAIEAARAGEAGRGFAVVADEVRKLAEKTMAATSEVGEAIEGIQQGTRKNIGNVEQAVKHIHNATTLAGESGEALTAIVTLVDRTTDQVRSIATASEQQSSTTEEINRSIMDINRISTETAGALRQSAQVLNDLSEQSQELRSIIADMHNDDAAKRPAAAGRTALPGRPMHRLAPSAA